MKAMTGLGLLFSLIGIGLGAWALVETRRNHSSRPLVPWWPPFRSWFADKVLRRRRQPTVLAVSTSDELNFASSIEAVVIPAADATVERQLAFLREQVDALRTKIGNERQERQASISALNSQLRGADEALGREIRSLHEKTESLAADSTWQQLWGLVLVGLGTVCLALPALWGWT